MPTVLSSIQFQDEAPKNVIRLIKSGEFYRAYNRSAWLFNVFINEYKVTRKFLKQMNRQIYYIGFPEKSLFSTIGDYNSTKTELGFDIELQTEMLPSDEDYEAWTQLVQTEPASRSDYNALPLTGAPAEREVLRRLRECPLESMTMVECVRFLAELRNMLQAK